MKITSSTNITSMYGTTLMSAIGLRRVRRALRVLLGCASMRYFVALPCTARCRIVVSSSANNSYRAIKVSVRAE